MDHTHLSISWVQLNNTVVPVIHRKSPNQQQDLCLIPLDVIRYATDLLNHASVHTVPCTSDEAVALTHACAQAGFNAIFSDTTMLIELDSVPKYSKQKIVFSLLPKSNPVGFARFRSNSNSDPIGDVRTEVESHAQNWVPQTNDRNDLMQHDNDTEHMQRQMSAFQCTAGDKDHAVRCTAIVLDGPHPAQSSASKGLPDAIITESLDNSHSIQSECDEHPTTIKQVLIDMYLLQLVVLFNINSYT
jgi:hypothetical protein